VAACCSLLWESQLQGRKDTRLALPGQLAELCHLDWREPATAMERSLPANTSFVSHGRRDSPTARSGRNDTQSLSSRLEGACDRNVEISPPQHQLHQPRASRIPHCAFRGRRWSRVADEIAQQWRDFAAPAPATEHTIVADVGL